MKTLRIPLVGSAHHRQSADSNIIPAIDTSDQRFVNVVFKRDANSLIPNTLYRVVKRPGIDTGTTTTSTSTGPYSGCGVTQDVGNPYHSLAIYPSTSSVHAITVILGLDGSPVTVQVSTHVTASRPFLLSDASADEYAMYTIYSSNGSHTKGFYTKCVGSSTQQIIDIDYNAQQTAGSHAFLDGYVFYMTMTGRIHNSELNNISSFVATDFVTVQDQSFGRGLARYKDKIVAFGSNYIEFYENVGNQTGSPLQQLDHLRIRGHGLWVDTPGGTALASVCPSQFYLAAMDTVFWINGSGSDAGVGVYMLDGFRQRKISTDDVDFSLSRIFEGNLKIQGLVNIFGYRYLVISTGNQSTDFVCAYCVDLGCWVTWESGLFTSTIGPFVNNKVITDGMQNEVLVYAGTRVHKFDIESLLYSDISYTDNDVGYSAIIQTRGLDFGTDKNKILHRVTLVGLTARETSNCVLSYSDDDGVTWSSGRTIDISQSWKSLSRWGKFRNRQFRITNGSDASMELAAIEFEYEVCRS